MIGALVQWLPAIRALGAELLATVRAPVFLVAIGAALVAGSGLWVWSRATDAARGECRAAELAARVAVLEQDLAAARLAAALADAHAAERSVLAEALRTERDAYAADLAARPAQPSVCRFSPDDVRRLMRHDGKPAARTRP